MQKFVWPALTVVIGYFYGAAVYRDPFPYNWPENSLALWIGVSVVMAFFGARRDQENRR